MRGILFDFNGVLVDDEPLHCRFLRETLAEEGIELTEHDYYETYLGFDDRGCFSTALAGAGRAVTPQAIHHLTEKKAARYAAHVERHGLPFFAGALDLLDGAVASGLAVGVVSGALRREIELALRHVGRLGLLRCLVAAEDVAEGKPNPEGYRQGFDRLAATLPARAVPLAPHEVVAIEDSPAGLASARGAGLRTLGVAHTYRSSELSLAEARVESLVGVSPAWLEAHFAAPSGGPTASPPGGAGPLPRR